jgi:hypothetical protein
MIHVERQEETLAASALVKHELLTLPERLSSPPVFSVYHKGRRSNSRL